MDDNLKPVLHTIESGKCLPFLGAGACASFVDKSGRLVEGLPSAGKLAEMLARGCRYPGQSDADRHFDLMEVSEYFVYRASGDPRELERAIQETIPADFSPRPIHTALAQLLQVKVILTTNYDQMLEKELERCRRNLTRHVYDPRDPRTGHFRAPPDRGDREEDIIVHKMRGSIDRPGSLVVTRSDYIRYLVNLNDVDRGMPEYLRKTVMSQSTLLFLGYGLEDWDFQVIWEAVLASYVRQGTLRPAYAVVKGSCDFKKDYWRNRGLVLLDMDLTEFAVGLAEHFRLEIPQLGIQRQRGNR